jgi:hypothetical protein
VADRNDYENLGVEYQEPQEDRQSPPKAQKQSASGDKKSTEGTKPSPSKERDMGATTENTEKKSAKDSKVKSEDETSLSRDSYGEFAGRHATRRGIDGVAVIGTTAACMGLYNLIVKD